LDDEEEDEEDEEEEGLDREPDAANVAGSRTTLGPPVNLDLPNGCICCCLNESVMKRGGKACVVMICFMSCLQSKAKERKVPCHRVRFEHSTRHHDQFRIIKVIKVKIKMVNCGFMNGVGRADGCPVFI